MAKLIKNKPYRAGSCNAWRSFLLCQALALSISPLLPLVAMAQNVPTPLVTTPVQSSTTILPTDVVPLADRDAFRTPMGELLQLKIMQRLPSQFYFSSSVEVTGRDETNPFQFPTKRALMAQLPRPATWRLLDAQDQVSLYDTVGEVARNNGVFRVLPNVSGGWTLDPHTRLFTNYFMIRDQLQTSMRLNTVIHSWGTGIQHDWAIGSKATAQFEFQGRELWQLHQQSVFDFLPGMTMSVVASPRVVLFANSLVQLRGKSVFEAPTKEIDPFYTWGGLYQRNGWTFSASTTFVQNFREPFHHNATIPKNSYVMISDYEIARRVLKQYPGLQTFVRAEPIWNFHSHNTPSLAGMDFRVFMGMRFAMAKPALTSTLNQIREQLKQEAEPGGPNAPAKPSAQIPQEDEISLNPQPIHGFLEKDSLAETCELPDGQMPVIADDAGQPAAEGQAANSLMAQEDSGGAPDTAQSSADGAAGGGIANNAKTAQNTSSVSGSAGHQSAAANQTASNAVKTPVKTLEEVASSTGAVPSAKATAAANAPIMDLSSAHLDWNGLDATPVATALESVDQNAELNSVVAQAAEKTNSLALQDRSVRIKQLAEQREKEYKLAMAPPAAPMPIKAPTATFVPRIQPRTASFTGASATVRPPAAVAHAEAAMAASLTPQPSGLTHSNIQIGQPNSSVKQSQQTALVPNLKAPEFGASNNVFQPLQNRANSSATYSANLAPSAIKSDQKMSEPVPLTAKANLSPNVVPTPVSGRYSISKGADKEQPSSSQLADLGSQSTPKNKVHFDKSKFGLIPLEEAKLDKVTETANSVAKSTQVERTVANNTKQVERTVADKAKPNQLIATANVPQLTKPSIPSAVNGNALGAIQLYRQANPLQTSQAATDHASKALSSTAAGSPAATLATSPTATTAKTANSVPQNVAKTASSNSAAATASASASSGSNVGRTTNVAMNVTAPKLSLPSSGSGTVRVNQAVPSTIATIPLIKPSSSVSGYISKPIIPPSLPKQPETDENSIAVSELSESEISSPKIAMAVYESWQSPVLDDPLIGGDSGSGTQSLRMVSSPVKSAHEETHAAPHKHKADSNRTDMHLIPPFPSANTDSKDGSLQDLKIPVLPVH